ncbi:MAG: Dihydroorotate dehydrogenase (NAD(+)), catalytic subunit [uncultured Thermomicrobiales bacterium]|uniref:Dihydroorotate dehydrogenase n=1 Tax=uncultured Thermomicrobiales bacterium TaxID=1645740 RepID=A0A6J4UP61_9BACT|nr:MAG: Dihydroorotate dehydrogenase (NAD(+)), catalytic subunit [uncultured Thermomicrobiales bacterium]
MVQADRPGTAVAQPSVLSPHHSIDLRVDLAPRNPHHELILRNPVIAASGCFGYGTEYAGIVEVQQLGAIVSKGVTYRRRRGARMPRLAETPAGMLNAIGLQNPGIKGVLARYPAIWSRWEVPVIVNLAGDTVGEFAEMAGLLDETPGVAGIELNISCPNVEAGGMFFGCDPGLAAEVTAAVRDATTLPLIVKLTPNVTDIVPVARACADAGADALSLINTLLGLAIDVRRRRPVLGNVTGGLSGPAVKPVALRMVYQVAAAVDVPVIGLGGITGLDDALEFLMAGASAVQVGTSTFADPGAMGRIIDGLRAWLAREGFGAVREIVGLANAGMRGEARGITGDERHAAGDAGEYEDEGEVDGGRRRRRD